MKIVCFFILFFCQFLQAQNDPIQETLNYLLQGNKDEEVNIEELTEQCRLILKNPININTSNENEITQIPLLSNEQAKEIINYRSQNGDIISIYELKHIGFSPSLLELLQHYFKTNPSKEPEANIIYILRAQSDFKNEENHLGNPSKIYSRFKYTNSLQELGFTTEKDQGESFLDKYHSHGFDFYSAYFQIKHKSSNIILGDYSINTGQGLVHSNSYRSIYSNSPLFSNLYQHQMKVYTSTNENSFFRGVAFRKEFKKLTIQPFISFKKLDASINNDTIKSFPNTGYHRTINELEKKDQCTELSFGNSLAYQWKNFNIGLNELLLKYSLPYQSDSNYYKNNIILSGWQHMHSIDYSWNLKNINLFGEIAMNNNFSFSSLNGIVISLNKTITFSSRTRHFPNHYFNPYAHTYSQSSTPKNEKGIDFSILLHLRKNEQMVINYDMYHHNQIKYGVKRPSYGKEFSFLYQKEFNQKMNFYVRYHFKENVELFDKNEIKTQHHSHQIRAHLNCKIAHQSSLSIRSEIHIYEAKTGWLTYLNINHPIKNSPFHLSFRYTLFNISDYDARIYAYENDVMYASTTPSFSSQGNQFYGLLKYRLNTHWSAWLKYSSKEIKIQIVWDK
ncbi:MAG: ComEA family DNA-binding protein [Flavobacteriales bacterium]